MELNAPRGATRCDTQFCQNMRSKTIAEVPVSSPYGRQARPIFRAAISFTFR